MSILSGNFWYIVDTIDKIIYVQLECIIERKVTKFRIASELVILVTLMV